MSRALKSASRALAAVMVVALGVLTTALAFGQDHAPAPIHEPGAAPQAPGARPRRATPADVVGSGHAAPEGAAAEGHAVAEGEASHAGGGHHGPEAINWTDIWDKKRPAVLALVINFGVLMTLYYMLGKKPITAALKQRRISIGKDIDEAQKLLAEAKERAKKYQGDLKNADVDASTAKASLISAGKGEVDRLLLEAQERADRMKRDADRLVEQERKQVHLDVLNETVELAVREATEILEKSVTAGDHIRLAQDLLTELAARPSAKDQGAAQ